jgi:hypothetical protein
VKRRFLTVGLLTLAFCVLAATPASADAVTRLPGGGWHVLDSTTPGGSVAIVTGPDTPPAGIGSLRMQVATAADRVLIGNELGELEARPWSGLSASYFTFVESGSPPAFAVTMRFAGFQQFTPPANAVNFTTLSFEPSRQGEVVGGEWQEWELGPTSVVWQSNAADAAFCVQADPCTFAQFVDRYPTGVWGQVQLGIGTGVAAATGFVDAVTVVDRTTRLSTDFGPVASPSASPSPSPVPGLPVTGMPDLRWPVLAGVSLILLGLILALPARRRRRSSRPGHQVY